MPLFLVRVREGEEVVSNEDQPLEFERLEDARKEAVFGARDILSQAVLKGEAASLDLRIEVTDEATGEVVLTMPVGRVTGTESQA